MTKKEIQDLKREVKEVTGLKIKDIEIVAVGADFIQYSYYKSKGHEIRKMKSGGTMQRKR